MSPTIHREGPYRFFFFSREESRRHVHVVCGEGEAKYWLEPSVLLSEHVGLDPRQLKLIQSIVEEHADEFRNAWREHFSL
jgi:hypothetical protein